MIRITVCDDSENDIQLIKNELERYCAKKHLQYSLSCFYKPELLLYELKDGKASEIFILDVSMPGMNGFELADQIRECSATCAIIFLTSHEEQAAEGYRSRALRFVIKLNMERDLPEALDCAVKEIFKSDTEVLTLRRYNDYWRIPYSEIICVNRVTRQLIISTESYGDITDSRGIREFFNELNDRRFIFIDRSCFVNIDYISQITGYSLKLKNGVTLPISRRSMQEVKQILLEQWGL
ncbi:MAG: LytR/AlgR family response regulator transcription factor [Acutalibacteraceae bacterium]